MTRASQARAQRQLEKKAGPTAVQQVPVPQGAPNIDQEFIQHVQNLISGKVQPRSEMSGYFVGKIREKQNHFDQVQKNVSNMEKQLAAMREELHRADGTIQSYVQDLHHWEKQPVVDTAPTPQDVPADPNCDVDDSDVEDAEPARKSA